MTVMLEVVDTSHAQWIPSEAVLAEWLQAAAGLVDCPEAAAVSFRFLDEAEAAELNSTYRGGTGATNVLSFGADLPAAVTSELGYQPLGDIVICPQVVAREAEHQAKTLEAHWAHLVLHGWLHLLGYDHQEPAAAEEMESLEISALQKLGIANPYLVG